MSSMPPQGPSTSGKGVWIAVFVMGAVIVALLAAVLFKLNHSAAEHPAPSATAASATAPVQVASAAQARTAESLEKPAPAPVPMQQPAAVAHPAPAPQPRPVAQNTAAPEQFAPQQFTTHPTPVQPVPQQPVCSNCGTVIAVTPQQVQSQQTNPVGVIAGGIVGGLLGNQIGGGDGRKLATVAGAIGGGLAGNEIAKRVDAQTVYDVQVRMENGQVRTMQLKVAPPVGQRVQIGADGGLNPIQ